MDNVQAANRASRMWRNLGGILENMAYDIAGKDDPFALDKALGYAKAADLCFWQATGEADGFSFARKTL